MTQFNLCKKNIETQTGFWNFVHCFLMTCRRWHGLCRLWSCCSCHIHSTCTTRSSLPFNIIHHHPAASGSCSSSSSSSGWCLFTAVPLRLSWRHRSALTTAQVSVHLLYDFLLWLGEMQIGHFTPYWILRAARHVHRWLVNVLAASKTCTF